MLGLEGGLRLSSTTTRTKPQGWPIYSPEQKRASRNTSRFLLSFLKVIHFKSNCYM